MASKSESPSPTVETRHRRSDDALRHIVAMIFEGRLSPGARLPSERELSKTLGISRSTLRDAMNRLEARGFVERRSKSGNYICTAIPQSLRDPIEDVVEKRAVGLGEIIEIRKVLEFWAVRKAAEAPSAESLAGLEQCLKDMQATSACRTEAQFARHSEADLKFHQVLAEMAGNPIYVHLFHFFAGLISRSILLSRQIVAGDFGRKNLAAHGQILKAIQSGDPARAEQAMLEHFNLVEKHLYSKRRAK